jgi:hypothetical protein
MYYQTIHQKRMVGGYVARDSREVWRFILENSFLHYLVDVPSYKARAVFGFSDLGEFASFYSSEPPARIDDPQTDYPPRKARNFLLRHRIRFVILHKACYPPEQFHRLQQLFSKASARKYFEDSTLLAYEIWNDDAR